MKSIKEARENGTTKKVFVLSPENEICAFTHLADARRARSTSDLLFDSPTEFEHMTAEFPGSRLAAVWNKIPGVTPIQKFKSRDTALQRIWQAIQMLEPVRPSKKKAAAPADSGAQARAGTKKATLLALLGRPEGASVREIMAALGWQSHSVRGYLSTLSRRNAAIHSFRRSTGERVYSTATATGSEPEKEVAQ
jgi:hypothetical protein